MAKCGTIFFVPQPFRNTGKIMTIQDPNTYKLLTPGPLTSSLTVREEMLVDRCTWDKDYKEMTQEVRRSLLELAHADPNEYTTVLMQGSGTFGVESVLSSIPGADDCVLVLVNGAYTERMCQILTYHHIHFKRLDFAWDSIPDAKKVDEFLANNPDVTMVAMVHSETTTGILNDIAAVGSVVKAAGKTFVVDAMSSFGGVDINVPEVGIDFLISSANKCIQGVPGFSFIIANIEKLQASKGNARSLSLDLYDQWRVMEKDGGKWRFTSPTHVVAAFHRAIAELKAEGGIAARHARYAQCNKMLRDGMKELGFDAYIDAAHQGPIITTFFYPENANFTFAGMYDYLKNHGYVIYPGKLTERDTFRLGNIGEIYEEDVKRVLAIFKAYLDEVNHA